MRITSRAAWCVALSLAVLLAAAPSLAQADIIVADIPSAYNWGSANNIAAFSCATTACNVGTAPMVWTNINDSNQHPVIAENMFRLKGGRIEQLGQAWVKHGFASANYSFCGSCQNPGTMSVIGVGCSDPYGAQQNGVQTSLAPKSEVNPATGYFPYPYNGSPPIPAVTGRRLQARHVDLDPTQNAGALYFIEVQYVCPGDIGQNFNNASYRRVNVIPNGASYGISFSGSIPTKREKAAVQAWQDQDPNVAITFVDVPGDGRMTMGFLATDNGNGTVHYEYAIHNLCSDRALQGLSIALPFGGNVTNVGFHDVDYHSNEPGGYALTDWTPAVTQGSVSWTTETYAANPAANALRWGTLYNFRFDSDQPVGDVTFTLFKPGTPAAIVVPTPYLGPAGAGNVGSTGGGPFNVLTVNGSTGGLARRVPVLVNQAITFGVTQPPNNGAPSSFVICGMIGVSGIGNPYALPFGIGAMLFVPCPLDPLDPNLFLLADSFSLGSCPPLLPATAAPWSTIAPAGVPTPIDVTLQGVIQDTTAPSTYAVTNAVILSVR